MAATAVVTAALTSAFWIALLFQRERPHAADPPIPVATAPAAPGEAITAPSGLVIPVAGVRADQLVDTFAQARAGGARVHDAIDIMAPHGTPVVAAAPGTVEKLFESEAGGLTVYVRAADRRHVHYYAHLQRYAPGLAEGRVLAKGDAIGAVGSTGNADPAGPHLHYAIHSIAPEQAWYQEGSAINPYPLLAGKAAPR